MKLLLSANFVICYPEITKFPPIETGACFDNPPAGSRHLLRRIAATDAAPAGRRPPRLGRPPDGNATSPAEKTLAHACQSEEECVGSVCATAKEGREDDQDNVSSLGVWAGMDGCARAPAGDSRKGAKKRLSKRRQ